MTTLGRMSKPEMSKYGLNEGGQDINLLNAKYYVHRIEDPKHCTSIKCGYG